MKWAFGEANDDQDFVQQVSPVHQQYADSGPHYEAFDYNAYFNDSTTVNDLMHLSELKECGPDELKECGPTEGGATEVKDSEPTVQQSIQTMETSPIALRKGKRAVLGGVYDKSLWGKQPVTTPMHPKTKKPGKTSDLPNAHEIYMARGPLPQTVYDLPIPNSFWPALYGNYDKDWLIDDYVMGGRPANGNWSILPPNFFQRLKYEALGPPADYLTGAVATFPPLWEVKWVVFPINVDRQHWLTGELELATWTITLYDSQNPDFAKTDVDRTLQEFTMTLT